MMQDRSTAGESSHDREVLKRRRQSMVVRVLKVAERNSRLLPAVHPDCLQTVFESSLKQVLIGCHVPRSRTGGGFDKQLHFVVSLIGFRH